MSYIVDVDRNQTRMLTTALDDLIDKDNSVRVIDAYVESLDLQELGFTDTVVQTEDNSLIDVSCYFYADYY